MNLQKEPKQPKKTRTKIHLLFEEKKECKMRPTKWFGMKIIIEIDNIFFTANGKKTKTKQFVKITMKIWWKKKQEL